MIETKKSQRQRIVFNGNVTEKEWATIPKGFNGDIDIYGNLEAHENIGTLGNICVRGNIESREITSGGLICEGNIHSDQLRVIGDLLCKGYIKSNPLIEGSKNKCGITARGDLLCEDYIDSGKISIGGNCYCNGNIKSRGIGSYSILVEGDLFCNGDIDSYGIKIDGEFSYKGHINTNGERIIVAGKEIFDY